MIKLLESLFQPSENFYVKVHIVKSDQEYKSLCRWRAYAYYRTHKWGRWQNAGLFKEVSGNSSYQKYSGNWRDEYLDDLHDEAYVKAIIFYRHKKLGLDHGRIKSYDLQIVEDFVAGRYSERPAVDPNMILPNTKNKNEVYKKYQLNK